MSASRRVTQIQEIASELKAKAWSTIELNLNEFGFPEVWKDGSFTKQKYLHQRLQQGSDTNVADLYHHLFPYGEEIQVLEKTEDASHLWNDNELRVFISHLSSNKDFAKELKANLSKYGISSFVAHEDVEPTAEWQREIEAALGSCDVLIALLTSKFHDSKWTDQEIGIAIGRKLPVLSVRMGSDPYGFFGKYQAIPYSSPDKLSDVLFKLLLRDSKVGERMADFTVERFVSSGLWQEAKDRALMLEKIERLNTSQISRIEEALVNNSQIREAYGVPKKIREFIEKWKLESE